MGNGKIVPLAMNSTNGAAGKYPPSGQYFPDSLCWERGTRGVGTIATYGSAWLRIFCVAGFVGIALRTGYSRAVRWGIYDMARHLVPGFRFGWASIANIFLHHFENGSAVIRMVSSEDWSLRGIFIAPWWWSNPSGMRFGFKFGLPWWLILPTWILLTAIIWRFTRRPKAGQAFPIVGCS